VLLNHEARKKNRTGMERHSRLMEANYTRSLVDGIPF
jgi:hypothetical protein